MALNPINSPRLKRFDRIAREMNTWLMVAAVSLSVIYLMIFLAGALPTDDMSPTSPTVVVRDPDHLEPHRPRPICPADDIDCNLGG
jgi:hypothetical protein